MLRHRGLFLGNSIKAATQVHPWRCTCMTCTRSFPHAMPSWRSDMPLGLGDLRQMAKDGAIVTWGGKKSGGDAKSVAAQLQVLP